MSDAWLLATEVARRYWVPPSSVRHWRHIRTGPQRAVIGRRVLYQESELIREREQAAKGAERRSA